MSRRITEYAVKRLSDNTIDAVGSDDISRDAVRLECTLRTVRRDLVIVAESEFAVGDLPGVRTDRSVATAQIQHLVAVPNVGFLKEESRSLIEFGRREEPRHGH